MTDVFISYKRGERDQVSLIASKLQELGLSVWFDARLETGGAFHGEINREVRSSKAVLVCWSPAAAESPWVLAEAQIGFERGVLTPAFLQACDLPPPFNGVQSLDLTCWAGQQDAPNWLAVLDRLGPLMGRSGLRHLALAIAAGEPVRVRGANEALIAMAAEPKIRPAPVRSPPSAQPLSQNLDDWAEHAGRMSGSVAQGAVSAARGVGRLFRAIFALMFALVLGPIALLFMRRPGLAFFSVLAALAGAAVQLNSRLFALPDWQGLLAAAGFAANLSAAAMLFLAMLFGVLGGLRRLSSEAPSAHGAPSSPNPLMFVAKTLLVLIFGPVALWMMRRKNLFRTILAVCLVLALLDSWRYVVDGYLGIAAESALVAWAKGHMLAALLFFAVGVTPQSTRERFEHGAATR